MQKHCRRCREHDEHYYWDHMDDEEKHFFKVMVGDFRHRMKIPKEFANNFRGHISDVIELEVLNGKKINVQVTRGLNKLVLESGWETFCSAHDVQQGDFLVFRYSGNSRFKVLIFHPNGCQKVSSCAVRKSGLTARQESGSSVEILGTSYGPSAPSLRKFGRGQRYDQRVKRKTEIVISTDSSSHNPVVPSPEGIQDLVDSADRRISNEYRYVLSRNCKLTRKQEAEVAVLEQKIQPEIPLYVTALNKTNIKDLLIFRMDYAVKYLPWEDETFTLYGPGGSKYGDVNFKICCDRKNALVTGWPGFVRSIGLREGDVCIFEISKRKTRVTITVHLLPGKKARH